MLLLLHRQGFRLLHSAGVQFTRTVEPLALQHQTRQSFVLNQESGRDKRALLVKHFHDGNFLPGADRYRRLPCLIKRKSAKNAVIYGLLQVAERGNELGFKKNLKTKSLKSVYQFPKY